MFVWTPVVQGLVQRAKNGADVTAEDLDAERVSVLEPARTSEVIRRELQRTASQEELEAFALNGEGGGEGGEHDLPAAWGPSEMIKMNELLR